MSLCNILVGEKIITSEDVNNHEGKGKQGYKRVHGGYDFLDRNEARHDTE